MTRMLTLFAQQLPWKFLRKLIFRQLIITSLVVIATALATRYYLKGYMQQQAEKQLTDSLELIHRTLTEQNINPLKWCESFPLNWTTRYTLIDHQGNVLCDNYVDIGHMDNHFSRPEIATARRIGIGSSIRYSASYGQEMIYGAIRFSSPSYFKEHLIIRQSVLLTNIDLALKYLDHKILIFLFFVLLVTSLLSLWNSLSIVLPMRSLLKKIENMRKTGFPLNEEATTVDNSDEWIIVESTLDQAKENTEIYLKELNRENEKFLTLMESIHDGILAIDKNDLVLFANMTFKDFFLSAEQSSRDLSMIKYWEFIRDADLKYLFHQLFETGESIKKVNFPLKILSSNEINYFDLTISPMVDNNDKIFGAVCVFHDVTARKMTEQMREDFVSNVSHEVRTPLTALKGYIQTIKQIIPDNEKINPLLDRIESNSDRLAILFDDILDLSVIESKNKMEYEYILVEDLTKTTVTNIRQSYPNSTTQVECHYLTDKAWGNRSFLEQALTNLIDNAFKYVGKENATIHITWSLENNNIMLKVEDNGKGIDDIHHPRLFERFYRVDPARNSKIKGSGLGLAIVKHIVQKHDGRISVSHGEQGGTVFHVTLPYQNKESS